MKRLLAFMIAFVLLTALLPANTFAKTVTKAQAADATVSPYLQQLPADFSGCSNLYDLLAPVKGYYNATKYTTSNGNVLSVVIPVEPGDRIAASSFAPKPENMGSVDGIRVTYLLGNQIKTSVSADVVCNDYVTKGYITVPAGVDTVCIPWWAPSANNWMTLAQKSKNYATHSIKIVSEQPPTCTENGYTAGEVCEYCDFSGSREEIPATGHSYSGNKCTVCGQVNLPTILEGKYVSVLGDSISTFNGYSNDATVNTTISDNAPRYDAGTADTKPGSYCLLESVNDTWWMHFANRTGMKLLVNNAWAGSQVFGGNTSDGRKIPAAYLERCVNLHDNTLVNNPNNAPIHPDIIFVYLGINDYNFNRSNVGDGAVDYASLVSSDGTYATPTTFGQAYGIMLHKMLTAYPNAQIFAMTLLPENLYSVDKTAWEKHNAYIRAAAEYYDIPLVDLAEKCAITWSNYSGYMIDKIHPTTAGMQLISDCIEAELTAYYSNTDYAPSSGYMALSADRNVDITLTGDLYVDLNGFDMTGKIDTNGYAVYGMDSSTNSYTCENMGSFSCVDAEGSAIVPENTYKAEDTKRYVTIETKNGYTFHRIYVGITKKSLAPSVTGVGYKAEFYGDEMVRTQVTGIGYDLWLEDGNIISRNAAFQNELTLRVNNFDAANYGQTNLHATVWMTIGDETIYSSECSLTLRQMVESVNADAIAYSEAQLQAVRSMIATNPVMETWQVENLYFA